MGNVSCVTLSAHAAAGFGGNEIPEGILLTRKAAEINSGRMIGFLIVLLIGIAVIIFGFIVRYQKKPVPFWNIKQKVEVTDVGSYNRSVGKIWIVYGILLCLFGIPMLAGQNSAWIILSILGMAFSSIGIMAAYNFVEGRCRKK